jgi:hypothetical protein
VTAPLVALIVGLFCGFCFGRVDYYERRVDHEPLDIRRALRRSVPAWKHQRYVDNPVRRWSGR